MLFYNALIGSTENTTLPPPSNVEPIRMLVIGDSIGNGTNEIYPEPDTDDSIQGIAGADTLYEWDGSTLQERVRDTIGSNNGSQYPSLAIKLKQLTGRVTHIVETAIGGAEFSANGDDRNYSIYGYMYGDAVVKSNSYLNNQGVSGFDLIKITLGINDARGSAALSNIELDAISLIDRLNSDFPNTPIVINQLGKSSAAYSRVTAIRGYIDDLVANYSNVYAGKDLNLYPESYYFDGLHLSQQYNNVFGEEDAIIINTSIF